MPVSETIGSGQQEILHFGAVKFRVNGTGNLRIRWVGLDNTNQQVLVPLVMAASPGKQPTRLSNFIGQRALLEGKTTAINEIMRINKIVIWSKPLWSEYAVNQ